MLGQRGHSVTVFSRGRTRPNFGDNIRFIEGERADPAAWNLIFRNTDYDFVIDNIAFDEKDVASLKSAAETSIGAYLMVSTAWVYNALGQPLAAHSISESDFCVKKFPDRDTIYSRLVSQNLPDITRSYIMNKVEAEAAAHRLNCRKIIVRPCMISGAGDHLGRIQFYTERIARGLPIAKHAKWSMQFQLGWVDDVARAMVALVEQSEIDGQTFNICPPALTSVEEVVSIIGRALRQKPQIVSLDDSYLESDYMTREPFSFFVSACYASDSLLRAVPAFLYRPLEEWVAEVAKEISTS